MTIYDLPAINAGLNGLSAVLLAAGRWFIHRSNRQAHRACMIAAFLSSSLFLAGYLYYHSQTGTTRFENPADFRPYYLALLLTHTVLAVVIVPLVFVTFAYAAKGRFERHKAVARWTFPLWMYVSVTGVIIYLLLYQVFPQNTGGSHPGTAPSWRI